MKEIQFFTKDTNTAAHVSQVLFKHYSEGNGTPLKITISPDKPKRSGAQNKYYWGVLVAMAVEYYKKHIGDLIRDVLDALKFEVTTKFVHELFKMLFNGGKSTTENDTEAMEAYHLRIRDHFLYRFNYDLPPPNEDVMEGFNED